MRLFTSVVATAFALSLARITLAVAIQVVPAYPGTTPGDVFDVSNPGIVYALDSTTSFNPVGYDIRDLFGGQFDSYAPERGNVVFADNRAIGSAATVFVTLPNPVRLTGFNLCVAEDGGSSTGTGYRSMREFKLFAGATLVDDVHVLDNSGNQTYVGVYGGTILNIADTFSNAPSAASYTLQFIQNQNANDRSGLRVIEFDAAVPEPASFSVFALAGMALSLRRRCY